MKTMTPHINRIRHLVPLLLVLVVPLLTLALLAATAPGPRDLDTARSFPMGDLAGNAASGAAVRKNDPLAIEAAFPLESYRPGSIAVLRYWATLPDVTLQVFRVGPERTKTDGQDGDAGRAGDPSEAPRADRGRQLHATSRSATGRPACTSPG